MTTPPNATPAQPEGDLRARILAEAVKLFADCGYGPTSMRKVSEAAGCTKPALYYHFGSKDELFRAAVEQCMTGLEPMLAQVALVQGTVRDRIVVFARVMFELLRSDPAPMRLMLAMQTRPDHSQPDIDFALHHARNQAQLRAMFATGVESGEISPSVDLDDAAMALTGILHARVFLALKGVPTPDDTPERIVAMLFDGIGTSSSPSSSSS